MTRRLMMTGCALAPSLAGALAMGGPWSFQRRRLRASSRLAPRTGTTALRATGGCVSYFQTMTSSGRPHSSAYIASYCSLFTYPGYVYDPYAKAFVYVTSHGQCVKYANEHYKP